MIIIVDKNEEATSKSTVDSLRKHFSHVRVGNLKAGDINIPLDDGCLLAIERKAPHDFLASIADRRIFEQAESMAVIAKYSAFIVTGKFIYHEKTDDVWVDGRKTNWRGTSVRSVITLLQYSGCALIFCPVKEYARQVEELYSTVNKPEMRKGLKQRRIVTWPPVDERVNMLASIAGIGLMRAESLLKFAKVEIEDGDDEYGTLGMALHWATIMNMVPKTERPKGWGYKTVLNVRKLLGLKPNEYIGINKED
jgi:ERCC4-type nuclease